MHKSLIFCSTSLWFQSRTYLDYIQNKYGYTIRTSGAACFRAKPESARLSDKLSVNTHTHLNLPKPLLHVMYARIKG